MLHKAVELLLFYCVDDFFDVMPMFWREFRHGFDNLFSDVVIISLKNLSDKKSKLVGVFKIDEHVTFAIV